MGAAGALMAIWGPRTLQKRPPPLPPGRAPGPPARAGGRSPTCAPRRSPRCAVSAYRARMGGRRRAGRPAMAQGTCASRAFGGGPSAAAAPGAGEGPRRRDGSTPRPRSELAPGAACRRRPPMPLPRLPRPRLTPSLPATSPPWPSCSRARARSRSAWPRRGGPLVGRPAPGGRPGVRGAALAVARPGRGCGARGRELPSGARALFEAHALRDACAGVATRAPTPTPTPTHNTLPPPTPSPRTWWPSAPRPRSCLTRPRPSWGTTCCRWVGVAFEIWNFHGFA
jgi:hypothetical protein